MCTDVSALVMKRLFSNLSFVKRGMDAQNVVETPEGSKVLTFHHYTFSTLFSCITFESA